MTRIERIFTDKIKTDKIQTDKLGENLNRMG